jgi:hypothetical protein
MISGKNNNITYARIGGAWRPTTTTSNIIAKAHLAINNNNNMGNTIEHTPNTSTIESI